MNTLRGIETQAFRMVILVARRRGNEMNTLRGIETGVVGWSAGLSVVRSDRTSELPAGHRADEL